MSCEPSDAAFVVGKPEKQGLVERRPHPTDRRAEHLVLTAGGGTALRERLLELLARESPLAGLSGEQQRVLRDPLERMLQELPEQAVVRPWSGTGEGARTSVRLCAPPRPGDWPRRRRVRGGVIQSQGRPAGRRTP
jgi:hypothetical protein